METLSSQIAQREGKNSTAFTGWAAPVDSSSVNSAAKSGFCPREGAVERTPQILGLAQRLARLVEGLLPIREPAERAL